MAPENKQPAADPALAAPLEPPGRGRIPSDVTVALSNGDSDLNGILALQRINLAQNLSTEQSERDGFVTVVHTRAILERMHALAPSVVARHEDVVVGYALSMPVETSELLPVLVPMFKQLERLSFRGTPLTDMRYYVMGQICVAQAFRGQGLFEAMYAQHRRAFAGSYDLIVTEISARNGRSLRAHERTGLEVVHSFRDATDEWVIVAMRLM